MGYKVDKVKSIRVINKETGEEIYSKELGDWDTSMPYTIEEPTVSAEEMNERLVIKDSKSTQFTATMNIPPRPNIMFIISPGRKDGEYATKICFYRPKEYNWFQRFMYKICFGIAIKQGNEVRREFL
jgi:hypothetical protein